MTADLTQQPWVFHTDDCMDAYMLPCRCGADAENERRRAQQEADR